MTGSSEEARSLNWQEPHSRQLARGKAYVYVFPCGCEDFFKLGFSRQPFQRMHNLHRRYFDFFDLDRGFLVSTDSVKDARRLEKQLAKTLSLYRVQAPLEARREAAGHTEWYRGAYPSLLEEMTILGRIDGYSFRTPLRPWVREELSARSDLLFDWCSSILSMTPWGASSMDARFPALRIVRDVLDSFTALDIDLRPLISDETSRWYSQDREAFPLGPS